MTDANTLTVRVDGREVATLHVGSRAVMIRDTTYAPTERSRLLRDLESYDSTDDGHFARKIMRAIGKNFAEVTIKDEYKY